MYAPEPLASKPLLAALACLIAAPSWAATEHCEAKTSLAPPAVIELFTSEGCSSCPPADAWLSQAAQTPGVVALSFHVNYWDYLGWREPYASAETTARQRWLQKNAGAPNVFTPQVVLNGSNAARWDRLNPTTLPQLNAAHAPPLTLLREGNHVRARVSASANAQSLAGYWALVQPHTSSRVGAGENSGRTLTHHNVVLRLLDLPEWDATKDHEVRLQLDAQAALSVAFVVTDARRVKPIQALILPHCP
jgi:hypothetical protein